MLRHGLPGALKRAAYRYAHPCFFDANFSSLQKLSGSYRGLRREGAMIMKLVPLLDRSGNVKAWANPKSGWICNLVGNVYALVAFDGVFNLSGAQIGWWYGDHLRDRYGRVVLSRRSTTIEGLKVPRSEQIPQPPKMNLPSGHPVLRWLLPPPLKRHEWADIKSLFDNLAQIRAFEKKLRSFS